MEDIRKERVVDLVVFAKFTGCAGTGLFSDSSSPNVAAFRTLVVAG
jgi:hypothetical protein